MSPTTPTRTPSAVYWRRRLFTLGLVLALALLVVNVVRGGAASDAGVRASTASAPTDGSGGSDGAPDAPDVSGDQTSASGPGTRTGSKGKRKRAKAAAAAEPSVALPTAPVLVEPDGECLDTDLSITPTVLDAVAGRSATIELRLRTHGTPACTWSVSAETLAVKVSVGDDTVWASWECTSQVPERTVVVRQAVTSTYRMRWNTRRSDTGCPRLTEYAQPGEYRVTAAAYGGEPDFVIFELLPPPPPAPTPSPTPAPKAEGKDEERQGNDAKNRKNQKGEKKQQRSRG